MHNMYILTEFVKIHNFVLYFIKFCAIIRLHVFLRDNR